MNSDLPDTLTILAALPLTAEVRAAKVVTVVTVPPAPPLVLMARYLVSSMEWYSAFTYPPLRVAYPMLATSLTEARFSIGDA